MLTKDSLKKAETALKTASEVGLSVEDLFDPNEMSKTRKIAVALAVVGEFDDQVEELTEE